MTFDSTSGKKGTATPRIFVGTCPCSEIPLLGYANEFVKVLLTSVSPYLKVKTAESRVSVTLTPKELSTKQCQGRGSLASRNTGSFRTRAFFRQLSTHFIFHTPMEVDHMTDRMELFINITLQLACGLTLVRLLSTQRLMDMAAFQSTCNAQERLWLLDSMFGGQMSSYLDPTTREQLGLQFGMYSSPASKIGLVTDSIGLGMAIPISTSKCILSHSTSATANL